MVQKKAKEIKLHLGCGKRNIPGFINIDQSKYKHIDYNISVTDLSIFKNNKKAKISNPQIVNIANLSGQIAEFGGAQPTLGVTKISHSPP